MTDSSPPFEPSATAPTRSLAEVVEIIYLTHGCSCESHPTNGASAQCQAWRRRTAERVAAALRHPDDGGMALRPCPECGALIRAEHLLCWTCAMVSAARANDAALFAALDRSAERQPPSTAQEREQ